MISYIASVIGYMTVLLFGSTGELITEKSGNLNLGIPGIMCMGGIGGIFGAFVYSNYVNNDPEALVPFLAILITMLFAMLFSLLTAFIYAFLTISLKANQNVTGLALTTFGIGLSNFIGGCINQVASQGADLASYPEFCNIYKTNIKIPLLSNIPVIGETVFSSGFMTYLSLAIIVVVTIIINRTRVGLNIRAIGENPATADAAGLNVNRYKYVCTCLGGMIAGLGGLFFIMQYDGGWSQGMIEPFGWLSVALVIFVSWKPSVAILGSVVFGALYAVKDLNNLDDTMKILSSLIPYVVTLVVLVFSSMRKKRELQPPQSLGLSYFREER